ncbi:hypothetical protein MNBD_ALPHA05-1339 [hydrothermal vent metagenome]|uniref:TIGR02444 family protein n=1 Tax=hydrothermal vent metagenome TaxID=652676 RepID=A0A3B0SQ67_9ZZZZ
MTQARADDFWTWSLAHYRRPGAEPQLLALQDRFGCNVNILLWLCWCAEYFEAAQEPVITEAIDAIAGWNAKVTAKLRDVRRYMKTQGGDNADLRSDVKQAELDAEKVEQRRLQDIAINALAPAEDDSDEAIQTRARQNLNGYAALHGADRQKGLDAALLHPLIGNILGPSVAGDSEQGTGNE